jgi:hypothetical protein
MNPKAEDNSGEAPAAAKRKRWATPQVIVSESGSGSGSPANPLAAPEHTAPTTGKSAS